MYEFHRRAEERGHALPAAITLGEAEGLTAHARSVSIRLNQR